jgi:hypothetical protein
MAKASVKFPLSGITGSLQGADRTIGVDPGLASSFRANTTPSTSDKKSGYSTKLVAQTQETRGGSDARHKRSTTYCACDVGFRSLGSPKEQFLIPWWKTTMNDPLNKLSGYLIYMKCCLKGMAETEAFTNYSFISRYRIWNNSGADWVNQPLHFDEIPTYNLDGSDVRAFLLLLKKTTKGNIVYNALMIDTELSLTVPARGEILVTLPSLNYYDIAQVDVYSYKKS